VAKRQEDISASPDGNAVRVDDADCIGSRWRRLATGLVGVSVAGIAAVVLAGWLTDRIEWVRLGSQVSVMAFNTTLLAEMVGLALIALAFKRRCFSRFVGAAVAAFALATLLQYPLRADFGIDEFFFANPQTDAVLAGSRMAANAATCFVLLGLVLVFFGCNRGYAWPLFVAAVLSSAVSAISIIALIGHVAELPAAYGWSGTYGMAVSTAVALALSSGWLTFLAVSRNPARRTAITNWLPLVVGNVAIVSTFTLWHALEYRETQLVVQAARTQLGSFRDELIDELTSHQQALQRMGARWRSGNGTSETVWRDDATHFLHGMSGFRAIAWVDEQKHVQWLEPVEDGNDSLQAALDAYRPLRESLNLAEQRDITTAAPPVDDPRIKTYGGHWLCVPVSKRGVNDGWLIADLDMDGLINKVLGRLRMSGQIVTIREDGVVVYHTSSGLDRGDTSLMRTADIPFANVMLTFTGFPTRAWVAKRQEWLPQAVLGGGLTVSILLAVALQLASWSRESRRQAMAVSRQLQDEIQERKHIEQELRESLTLQQAILDNAGHSIISTSPEGVIEVFNRGAERMLGYTTDEMVGIRMPVVIHDAGEVAARAKELSEELGRTIDAGFDVFVAKPALEGIEQREWTYVRKDGSQLPVQLCVSSFRDSDGRITGYVGIASDITERKRFEEELRQAKLAAEDANRAKSEFLANMSHEIRTPMNGILGMVELVLGTPLTPDQKDYLNTIKDSADSLLSVINDILDFSKVEAGKMELDCVEFGLQERLGASMNALALRARQKELELICDIDSDVPEQLVGDPLRLRQVLVNLIGNAIKFTESGEIVVRVEREKTPVEVETVGDEVAVLHFAVSDTGIGIPREKQQTIFNAFEQADGTTTRHYGGTGLGLTISSSIVALMGGQIWVESLPCKGSTFHFTASFGVVREHPLAPVDISRFKGLAVLAVDDNATCRQVLYDMLVNWQFKPMLARDAPQALAMAKKAASQGNAIPLVLTDYRMPEIDGICLAEFIARDADLAGTKVVMFSSAAEPDMMARCQKAGVAAYVKKPVMPSQLLQSIFAVLSSTWPGAAAGENRDSVPAVYSAASTQPATRPVTGLNILLAEDNRINQQVAIRLLEQDQHRVTVAATGKQAVAEFEQQAFDLVLMDVQMPEMDGFEATATIRQMESTSGKHVPIVAVTAHAMKSDHERCLAAGMDGYLAKPIRPQELRDLIASLFQDRTCGPALDRDAALANVNGNMDFLQQLVDMFLEDFEPLLSEIHTAVELRAPEQIQRAAHHLKGSMMPFFAGAAIDAAQSLEDIGRSKSLSDAAAALEKLEHEVSRMSVELTGWQSQTSLEAATRPDSQIQGTIPCTG
jgi:two-component system sensor histidine kinase/response regulator